MTDLPQRNGIEKKVSAVYICDASFFFPALVSIKSLIDGRNKDTNLQIYVITVNVKAEDRMLLDRLSSERVLIKQIDGNTTKFERFKNSEAMTMSAVSIAALLKFDLSEVLEEDKILYIDGDTVIRSDLAELFSVDIENCFAAAVADSSSLYIKRNPIYDQDTYFNSGVLLLNLKKMRKEGTGEKLLETKIKLKDKRLMDQNAFNLVMKNQVRLLPIKYNFMYVNLYNAFGNWTIENFNSKYNTSYKTLEEICSDSVILHFASKNKPWKDPNVPGAHEWEIHFKHLLDTFGSKNLSVFASDTLHTFDTARLINDIDTDDPILAALKSENEKLKQTNRELKNSINSLVNTKTYRFSKKLSDLYHKIRNRKR